jgi:hypothetical protein
VIVSFAFDPLSKLLVRYIWQRDPSTPRPIRVRER